MHIPEEKDECRQSDEDGGECGTHPIELRSLKKYEFQKKVGEQKFEETLHEQLHAVES